MEVAENQIGFRIPEKVDQHELFRLRHSLITESEARVHFKLENNVTEILVTVDNMDNDLDIKKRITNIYNRWFKNLD
ncbi:hypothetical protein [Acinetobacter proteolyticus]|nr:hypothetical protein [Acinetobacter proteolyticus]